MSASWRASDLRDRFEDRRRQRQPREEQSDAHQEVRVSSLPLREVHVSVCVYFFGKLDRRARHRMPRAVNRAAAIGLAEVLWSRVGFRVEETDLL